MKRIIAWLLVLLLLFSVAAAEGNTEQPDGNRLTVGNPTPMRGEFFTSLWGNATSDLDVRDLLHGYNLVYLDNPTGTFKANPTAVEELLSIDDKDGNRVYTVMLARNLRYSDGSPITAWDYAFTWLFSLSREVAEIGGTVRRADQFLGYEEYMSGDVPYLAGVRVYGDYFMKITIRSEYIPFFYELGLLSCTPTPISVVAPGVRVKDDGKGAYLTNEDKSIEEPIYTADLLRETVLNPETGYLYHPSVVSGPYTLDSWDGETAVFTKNPYFLGDWEGKRPSIETLVYTTANNDTQIEDLKEGKFDLLNKVTRKDAIDGGLRLTGEGGFSETDYARTGLCFISFACEKDTVSSAAVRRAIAWCLDRDQLTEDYTGGYGQTVDGYYGIGQWMYGLATGAIEPPVKVPAAGENDKYRKRIAEYKALNLNKLTHYTVDTAKAAQILEADGWKLNDDGLREKNGVVLDLKMICPEGNNITEYLQETFLDNLEAVGIKLTIEVLPMGELLSHWYEQEERTEDMIYLGTNFDRIFDPNAFFDKDGNWAYTSLKDERLQRTASEMSKTEPGDLLTYTKRWIAFQERFNEILPMIPIYGNFYYDFYISKLQNYDIEANVTWGEAIIDAYLGEEAAAAEE